MRQFESKTLRVAFGSLFVCGALACSSDPGHPPPVGAPTTPVVISEGAGTGTDTGGGPVVSASGGNSNDPGNAQGGAGTLQGVAGGLSASGGIGSGFTNTSAGNSGSSLPGVAGSPSDTAFGASGGPSAFGGSGF